MERHTIPSSLPLSLVDTNVFLKLTTKQSSVAKPTQEIHGPRLLRKESTQNTRSVLAVERQYRKEKTTSLRHTPIAERRRWRGKEKTTFPTKTHKKRKNARRAMAIAELKVSTPQSTEERGPRQSAFPSRHHPTLSTNRTPRSSCFGLTA